MELSIPHGLLTRGTRIVVPTPLHGDILKRRHEAHQGITISEEREKEQRQQFGGQESMIRWNKLLKIADIARRRNLHRTRNL